jgi:hypothetical protein
MREDGRALEKAVDSGDTDLGMGYDRLCQYPTDQWIVYQVLLNLHKRLPLGDFFKLIEDGGPRVASASKLLQIYAREQNREMLRDFFYSDDRRLDSGLLLLEEASTQVSRLISAIISPTSDLRRILQHAQIPSKQHRGFFRKIENVHLKQR